MPSVAKEHPLGVLFVHGIGEQLQGETLTRFADPLAFWLSRWLSGGHEPEPGWRDSRVSVKTTALEPGDDASAETVMVTTGSISLPSSAAAAGPELALDWLLAESWWAETFRAPKTRTLLLWMLSVLPNMVLEQFFVPLQRVLRSESSGFLKGLWKGLRILASVVLVVVSLALAGLGLVFILLLLVPLLLPSEKLRGLARDAALKLASTLGDSFILTSSPVQFDAMVKRVARDLAWLATKTARVVVVAHSQGTAVAYAALRSYPIPEELSSFITVGQAIEKLQRAREMRRSPRKFRYVGAWAGIVCFYLFVVFLTRGITLVTGKHADSTWLAVDWSIVGAAGLATALVVGRLLVILKKARTRTEDLTKLTLPGSGTIKWLNYYASADPVPNGPLFQDSSPAWISETEVWNRASILTDHTSYADSPDDFVAHLACDLVRATPGTPSTGGWDPIIKWGEWRRHWRVGWLAAIRAFAFAGGIAGVVSIRLRNHLDDIGNGAFIHSAVHYVSIPLRATLGISVHVLSDSTLAGLVLIGVVLAAGYVLMVGVWRLWETQDVDRFFRREEAALLGHSAPLGGFYFGALVTLLAFVTTISVFVAVYGDYPRTWSTLYQDWLWTLIAPAVAGPLTWIVLTFRGPSIELRLRG